MKTPLILTAGIILLGVILGLLGNARLAEKRTAIVRLEARAAEAGFDPASAVDPRQAAREALLQRHREAEKAATSQLYADLKALVDRFRETEANGGRPTPELETAGIEMMTRMMDLSLPQLQDLMDLLRQDAELDDQLRAELASFSLLMLGQQAPDKALELVLADDVLFGGRETVEQAASQLLMQWAARDPAAAAAWLEKNRDRHPGLEDTDLQAHLAAGAARQDPREAMRLIAAAPADDRQAMLNRLGMFSDSTSRLDALNAFRNSDLHGDPKLRESLLRQFARGLTEDGFEASTAWFEKANLSPEEAAEVAKGIADHARGPDTSKWMDWMVDHLGEKEVPDRIGRTMTHWTQRDYLAAGTWLAEAKDGPAKTAAVRSYARAVAPYDPDAAAQWAETLPSNKNRTEVLRHIHTQWQKTDPAAARAFASRHGLEQPGE